MKELNKNTLKDALDRLPQHEPPSELWSQLGNALDQEQVWQEGLEELPEYDPPEQIWSAIEEGLDKAPKLDTLRPRKTSWWRYAAAAMIILSVGAGSWWYQYANREMEYVSFSTSEESVAAGYLEVNWDEDQDAFTMVEAFCQDNNLLCQQPEFKVMKEELDALNEARDDLKIALDTYGTDAELITQLTDIEYERTALLKKIMARIYS